MKKMVSIFQLVLSLILLVGLTSSALAQQKVVVIPLAGNDVDASDLANKLIISPDMDSCVFTPCTDSPSFVQCPIGKVMVGIDMPEYGGNEGSCNTNSTTGPDDFRIQCCDLKVTAQ